MDVDFGAYGADVSTITLDFSGESLGKDLVDGVTQYGSGFTTKAYYQDGYPMGVLQDFSVGQDGTIVGSYSNGRNKTLYSLPVALFANPQGLVKEGETLFSVSPNSGLPEIVTPQEGGAGSILGGTLEMANVDLTEEFVNLIMAQRGFQANARVITTSDQVLEELMNIKR
jgi:flagellar hook protein FlgE